MLLIPLRFRRLHSADKEMTLEWCGKTMCIFCCFLYFGTFYVGVLLDLSVTNLVLRVETDGSVSLLCTICACAHEIEGATVTQVLLAKFPSPRAELAAFKFERVRC